MNTSISTARKTLTVVAAAAAACVSTAAFAEFNANIEFDNTYKNQKRGLTQAGRVELNAFNKAGANYFVAGRASFLAKKDGSVSTDDMWVQAGSSFADVKLGRFEAADLFRIPRDVLIMYANNDGVGDVYRAHRLRGRTGSNVFHGAGTLNFGGGLSLELGVVETRSTKTTSATTYQADLVTGVVTATTTTTDTGEYVAAKGFRPVLTYASGPVLLRAGVESIKFAKGGETRTGFGFTGSYDFGPVNLIANVAANKTAAGNKQTSFGLIGDAKFGLTGGVIYGTTEVPGAADYKVTTGYLAYGIPLFDIKGATITPALGYSKASGSNTSLDEKGATLRFNYAF